MIKVGILGARGYTAYELMRLLVNHPQARLACLMARGEEPEPVENYFPSLRGLVETPVEPLDLEAMARRCDVVFLALPHTIAQEYAPKLLEAGVKLVDLSADFRFSDVELYEATYKVKHLAPELNATFPYGLPELFMDEIQGSRAVANPGCYTTTAILTLAPFMAWSDCLDLNRIVINALSGVSGAGVKPSPATHFPECNESVNAYGIASHRHRPEIEESLSRLANRSIKLVFTPHLIPINRGILATCTIPMTQPIETAEAHARLMEFYAGKPFVRVLPAGQTPKTAAVFMSNFIDIGVVADTHAGQLIAIGAIDNLTKGASGQAIQNMNIICGLPETMGLLPAKD